MNFLDYLIDDSILIVPNNIKEKVLKKIYNKRLLKSLKIMTFNDLKKGLLFDYTNETIYYVMKNRNVNYGVAKDLINNIYYLDSECKSEKMRDLSSLNQQLVNNNLLIIDNLFINLLKSKKKVYVYGFDYIKKFDQYLLKLIKDIVDIEIIDKEDCYYHHDVYELKNMSEEVNFVFEKIAKLISDGVDLDHIFIANYSDDYYFNFKVASKQFNLPIFVKSETTLYQTAIGEYFLNHLDNNLDLLIYKIKKKFDEKNNVENAMVINKLVSMLNSYYWCNDILSAKNLLEEEMKHVRIGTSHKRKEISTTDIINNVFDDDEYVFLIGFNLGIIPKFKRDEDYINDAIKPPFLETSDEYNAIVKDQYLKAIGNIKNLTITYKLNDYFKSYSPSFLVNNDLFNVIKDKAIISSFASDCNRLNLARSIDKLVKFNEKSDELEILFSSYDIPYKTYDNSFTGIDKEALKKDIDNKLVFSYSNISKYYECPFMFYLNSILKINDFEDSLEQFIGNLFHYTLEHTLDGDRLIEEVYDEFVNNNLEKPTYKEKFFINLLKKEIKFIVETIKEQYKHSTHTDTLFEKEIIVDVEREIKTKIKGFVDKILVLNNYLLVIDYKTTSSQGIDSDLFEFGLSLQLPIYLYLLKCLDKNYEVAGLYIQHILDLNREYNQKKDSLEEKKKKLKLEGITFDNISIISKFDDTYDKSEVIKSLSTKDGAIKKNKNILSLEERDELISLMERLLMKAIDDVSNAIFPIRPIKIDSKSIDGCKYCTYKDVCYRKYKDFNYQKITKQEVKEDE